MQIHFWFPLASMRNDGPFSRATISMRNVFRIEQTLFNVAIILLACGVEMDVLRQLVRLQPCPSMKPSHFSRRVT